jgi:hypothetical protein
MLSDLLIASGPITYILCWVVILLIICTCDTSEPVKAGLITYAVLPVGPICQSGVGLLLAGLGL